MANLVRARSWGDIKPALGSQIDRGHPLADGLRCAFLLNENGGLTVVDAAHDGIARITSGTSTPAWGRGGLHFNGTVTGTQPEQIDADPRHPSNTTLTPPLTMDAVVRIAGNTKGAVAWLGNGDVQTGGVLVDAIGMGVGNTTLDDSGTNLITLNENVAWHATSRAIPANQWAHIALVWRGYSTTAYAYVNGFATSLSWSAAYGSGTSVSPFRFYIGGYTSSNGAPNRVFTGDVATARLWSQALSPDQIAWLAAEPYAFVQPPGPKSLYVAFPPASDLAIPLLRPIPQYAVHRM